jgi:hypothetical protein
MIKYMEYVNEATTMGAKKIKREDLKVGDDVLTNGFFDDVELHLKLGKIIKMYDYGKILVEFAESFDKKNLHSGFKDIGKPGHCFYIPIDNIKSNDKERFEEIINREKTYDTETEWWFANRGKKPQHEELH